MSVGNEQFRTVEWSLTISDAFVGQGFKECDQSIHFFIVKSFAATLEQSPDRTDFRVEVWITWEVSTPCVEFHDIF